MWNMKVASKVRAHSEASSFPILFPSFPSVTAALSVWPLLSAPLFAQMSRCTYIFLFALFSYTLVLLCTLPHALPTIRSPGNPSTVCYVNPHHSFARRPVLYRVGVRRLLRPLSQVGRPHCLQSQTVWIVSPVFSSGARSPGKRVCSWLDGRVAPRTGCASSPSCRGSWVLLASFTRALLCF